MGESKGVRHWLLTGMTESNLQLFALISIWISSKIYDSPPLSVKSLKSLGDAYVSEQHFTTRDLVEAVSYISSKSGVMGAQIYLLMDMTLMKIVAGSGVLAGISCCYCSLDNWFCNILCLLSIFAFHRLVVTLLSWSVSFKVLKFGIGTSNIAFVFLDEILNQFKEVACAGKYVNSDICMDILDLLYENEETSMLYRNPRALAASVLVAAYLIAVPVQKWEFPVLPWVRFAMSCKEEDITEAVTRILKHVLEPRGQILKSRKRKSTLNTISGSKDH